MPAPKQQRDQSSILQAAITGNLPVLQQASDDDLLAAKCYSGCTVLHWAAGSNQVAVLHYLLQNRRRSSFLQKEPTVCSCDATTSSCNSSVTEDNEQIPDKQSCCCDNNENHQQPFLFHANVKVAPQAKASGRTPLHYACRNGCLEAAQYLVNQANATVDVRAKHGVTPFQLAIWRNHLTICQWLVQDCQVDPCETNDFECGAIHWLAMAPVECAGRLNEDEPNEHEAHYKLPIGSTGSALIPTAQWLSQQPGINFHAQQRQGHTPLHKAAWMGHLAMIHYLHTVHDLWDDHQDEAGNYAADLSDMAPRENLNHHNHSTTTTTPHAAVADYLRAFCSRERAQSCAILEVSLEATATQIRQAYLSKAKQVHPDRIHRPGIPKNSDSACQNAEIGDFDAVSKAYQHLTAGNGRGQQSNPAHSLNLMLQVSGVGQQLSSSSVKGGQEQPFGTNDSDDCFKARLIAVLLEYGNKGLDLSNVKKKWKQVWPDSPFPNPPRRIPLSKWIRQQAGDAVDLIQDDKGCLRVYSKHCTQDKVAAAAMKLRQHSTHQQ